MGSVETVMMDAQAALDTGLIESLRESGVMVSTKDGFLSIYYPARVVFEKFITVESLISWALYRRSMGTSSKADMTVLDYYGDEMIATVVLKGLI